MGWAGAWQGRQAFVCGAYVEGAFVPSYNCTPCDYYAETDVDPQCTRFEQPVYQTYLMFAGEFLCILVYALSVYIAARRGTMEKADQSGLTGYDPHAPTRAHMQMHAYRRIHTDASPHTRTHADARIQTHTYTLAQVCHTDCGVRTARAGPAPLHVCALSLSVSLCVSGVTVCFFLSLCVCLCMRIPLSPSPPLSLSACVWG
jgi:hypothetical protein